MALTAGLALGARPAGAGLAGDGHVSASLACGEVVLPGYAWLGGDGVDVFSNGDDAGNGNSCGGISSVNGVVSGEEWQCVELIDRLYLTRGWIRSTWFGNGADMYRLAPGNLAEQPQGSISFLSPGDVISYESPGGVEPGHAGIVNEVTPISLGRYEVQMVQQNGFLYTYGILSDGVLTMTTGWVRNFPVIGVIHHPGATPPVPGTQPANLLQNGSFEHDRTAGWKWQRPVGGKLYALAKPAPDVPEGNNLFEMSTTRTDGSLYQDVTMPLVPGESYTFSIWARANAKVTERICVVLWGVGQSTEHGQTCVRIGSTWTLVSAPYDVGAAGLDRLRAQVYLVTTGVNLELTGASLADDGLANASFEGAQTAGWEMGNPKGGRVRTFAHRAPGLPEGGSLLEVSSSRSGGSVYQDVPLIAVPGQSYTFSIWVRSAATTKANVCVVLWGIGSGIQVHGQTCALVSTTWTQLSAPLDVDTAGLADLRAQVYLHTSNIKVDLTGSALVNDGLSSASFENNATTGWTTQSPRGATTRALAEKAPGLPEDGHLLKLGTSRPGGSVYQDVPAILAPNQSYTFSIWLRSNAPSKERVCVVLWGLGGTAQKGQTCLSVGPTWTLVSAPYDVSATGLRGLRAQVYLFTAGPRLDLTGASLGGAA